MVIDWLHSGGRTGKAQMIPPAASLRACAGERAIEGGLQRAGERLAFLGGVVGTGAQQSAWETGSLGRNQNNRRIDVPPPQRREEGAAVLVAALDIYQQRSEVVMPVDPHVGLIES